MASSPTTPRTTHAAVAAAVAPPPPRSAVLPFRPRLPPASSPIPKSLNSARRGPAPTNPVSMQLRTQCADRRRRSAAASTRARCLRGRSLSSTPRLLGHASRRSSRRPSCTTPRTTKLLIRPLLPNLTFAPTTILPSMPRQTMTLPAIRRHPHLKIIIQTAKRIKKR